MNLPMILVAALVLEVAVLIYLYRHPPEEPVEIPISGREWLAATEGDGVLARVEVGPIGPLKWVVMGLRFPGRDRAAVIRRAETGLVQEVNRQGWEMIGSPMSTVEHHRGRVTVCASVMCWADNDQ